MSMSDIGRALRKKPGAIQRALNALEAQGFLVSSRKSNMRIFSISDGHPLRPYSFWPEVVLRDRPPASIVDCVVQEPKAAYETSQLKLLILAGPNGAGKTTFAREFLQNEAACMQFINADLIARGLSPFSPEAAAMKAGRLMIRELNDHLQHQRSVALETTLSGSIYAKLIPEWREQGYKVKLIFLSLPSVALAIERVAIRVQQGGHSIPGPVIRRRYESGWRNLDSTYKSLVDCWTVYDSSGPEPVLLEEGES
jgi:predicted ABC-type ATPase